MKWALANIRRFFSAAEFSTIAAIGVVAGASFAFIAIADEVIEAETNAFDDWVLRALRNPADPADPIGPTWLEAVFVDLTSLGSTTVLTLVTIATAGYLIVKHKRGAALLVLLSVAGGTALSTLLKNLFARPRPELVAHLVEVRTLSFPSGHAMLSAVTFLTIGALLASVEPRLWTRIYILAMAVLLTLLIGMSRVYLGVHFPTDVLAGWCAGVAWAMACWLVARYLQARGQVEPPSS